MSAKRSGQENVSFERFETAKYVWGTFVAFYLTFQHFSIKCLWPCFGILATADSNFSTNFTKHRSFKGIKNMSTQFTQFGCSSQRGPFFFFCKIRHFSPHVDLVISAVQCSPECIRVLGVFWRNLLCCVFVCVSDGKTQHGIGHFIIANVISCSPLLPLPPQHKRPLPDREKYNTTTWPSRSSHLSPYLLPLSLSVAHSLLLYSRGEKNVSSPFWVLMCVLPSILTFSAFPLSYIMIFLCFWRLRKHCGVDWTTTLP